MQIIGTTEISFKIEKLLETATNFLIIVSPYIKLNKRLKVKLSDSFKKVDSVYFIHREDKINQETINWLKSYQNINLFSIRNLHSKIYINDSFALLTSMNLYEYSQINNHEIGVTIDSKTNHKEYNDILNQIRIIVESEYKNSKITTLYESFQTYLMRELFNYFKTTYIIPNNSQKNSYELFSDEVRKLVSIKNNELYQDKTAILRNVNLGKQRFFLLKKELKKVFIIK